MTPNERMKLSGGFLQQWLRGKSLYNASKREAAGEATAGLSIPLARTRIAFPTHSGAGGARNLS